MRPPDSRIIDKSGGFMLSQEKFLEMLNEIADEIPREFFNELNGGILLRPEAKLHPDSEPWRRLWVMGEYRRSSTLGRSIYIYYGSFEKLHGNLDESELRKKVRHTVIHEFRHHLESLAGEHDLEYEDACNLAKYKMDDIL